MKLYLQNQEACQIWPMGHSLPTPDFKQQPTLCFTVLWVDNLDEFLLCHFLALARLPHASAARCQAGRDWLV